MNLQYSPLFNCPPETALHCRLIFYLTHFELLAMVIEVPSFFLAIYATLKSPFHYNLTFIGIFMLSGYYVFMVGRLVTCLYEIGAIRFIDLDNDDIPFSLFISSILQFFYMGCACGISLASAFERFFATYFVDTYEIRKRKWISLAICSEVTLTCFLAAFIMIFDFIPIAIMAFVGVFVSCVSLLFFQVLFTLNKRRMERIQQERMDDKYSLSVRFQLCENLKVMKLLQNVCFFSVFNNVVMATMLTLYTSEKFQTNFPIITLYLHFAFNQCVILYSFVILLIMMFSVRQYRLFFLSLRGIRIIFYPIVGRCFKNDLSSAAVVPMESMTVSAETDCYFSNLSNQWDQRFDKVYQ